MSLPPLPPHPHQVKSGLERFGVYGTRWAAMAVIGITLLWTVPQRETVLPMPVGPQVPVQEWSTSPDWTIIGRALRGGLPPPDPRQRKAPCDTDTEVEVDGYCWAPLELRPCPKRKAFEHEGRCLMRVLRVVPPPQSGEVRAGNVAGEP